MAVTPEVPRLPQIPHPAPRERGSVRWGLPISITLAALAGAGLMPFPGETSPSNSPQPEAKTEAFDCGILSPGADATGEYIEFNNKPATGCNLAPQSEVLNPVKIVGTKQFILPPYTQEDPIGLNQSFILGDSCYTITYTVPYDANIATFTMVPIDTGAQLITLGSGSIKVEDKDFNLILQLQKRPLENGEIDQQRCPVYTIDPANFGEHQQITPDLFKNE